MDHPQTKSQVMDLIKQHDCTIIKEEDLGIRNLAYTIKKKEKGFYFYVHVDFPAHAVKELNHDIRLNENILKYMCLILKEKKQKPPKEKSKKRSKVSEDRQSQEHTGSNEQQPEMSSNQQA